MFLGQVERSFDLRAWKLVQVLFVVIRHVVAEVFENCGPRLIWQLERDIWLVPNPCLFTDVPIKLDSP